MNAWIKSRLNHSLRVKGSYADRYLNRMRAAFNNPSLDIDDLQRHWKQAWKRHETDLERYFTGRNNYFAFDIGAPEEQAKLCCFLRSRGYSIEGDALPMSVQPAHLKLDPLLAVPRHHRYPGPPAFAM